MNGKKPSGSTILNFSESEVILMEVSSGSYYQLLEAKYTPIPSLQTVVLTIPILTA